MVSMLGVEIFKLVWEKTMGREEYIIKRLAKTKSCEKANGKPSF